MKNEFKSFLRFRLPVYAYASVILLYSTLRQPLPKKLMWIPNIDLVLHAIEYAVLGFLVIRMLRSLQYDFDLKKTVFLSIFYSTLYGALIELYQLFIPYRCCSIFDLTADFVGATIGTLIYVKFAIRKAV